MMKNNYYQNRILYLMALGIVLLSGCRNGKVTITISPQTVTVELGQTQQFQATVTPSNAQVSWTVDEGNAWGTIVEDGLYIAPDLLPSPPIATVRVSSISDPTVSATAKVTISDGGGGNTTTTTPGEGGGTGGGIGAACGTCDPGLSCITSAPGGYCTKSCASNSDCGQGAYCYQLQDEQGQKQALCLDACSANTDCRAGYTCQGDPG
ncbi:MAG: Ig-like domain-containing protein, partial [Proteobacteria bacterium]|nr:Ig-like domain-containing protein [Pseudomonadota bacterium]